MKQADSKLEARLGRAWAVYSAGRFDEARQLYAAICRKHPRDDRAWMMQGVIAGQRGEYVRAEQCLRRAVALRPDNLDACLNHGLALFNLGELEQAIDIYHKLLEQVPGHAQTLLQLGNACARDDRLLEAEAAYMTVLQSDPEIAAACGNLANVLAYQGRPAAALEYYQRALRLDPKQPGVHSNLLLCLHYDDLLAPSEVYDMHRAWSDIHTAGIPRYTDFPNSTDPGRRLRIGLVTPDLRTHSVAYFIEPLLTHSNRDKFELLCYADSRFNDRTTARLGAHLAVLRDMSCLSDEALAGTIREDCIDILIDLAGHTENNRLPVFARRPAPVQVTWLGYPDTTGLDEIDYRITDVRADPPGQSEPYCSEQLVRLDCGFLCYAPPVEAEPVSPLPAFTNGYVTFGSFNALTKITSDMQDAWAAILEQLPDARLLIKNRQLTDPGLRSRMLERFNHRGIDAERLTLLGKTTRHEHMSAYHGVDIALDTYPYNGTTTTCDAMWMGIPVVTRVGSTHVSRVGASLLSRVGLDELVCADTEDYIGRALSLANDIEQLSSLRAGLRETMLASPLCTAASFAFEFQEALGGIWRRWCSSRHG